MKVLITGVRGQLGQDMYQVCTAVGYEVIACGSQELDITRFEETMKIIQDIRPDLVINCAAYNAVDQAESDYEQAFRVNGFGPKNLALAASAVKATLVHFSTDYVFSGEKKDKYTLVDTPDPISRYGESKLLGEQMVTRHADQYFLIRVSWVFGAGNTNFVKKVLEWSENNDMITVVDDQISSPTYTRDLAQATLDLVQSEQFGLFHITNSGFCSRYDWASFILNQTGWTGTLNHGKSSDFQTPAARPPFSVLDNMGTKEAVGYILPSWQDATRSFLHEIGRI